MRIVSAQVENYKSFRSLAKIQLTSGFNVIVGQNNVGKTALVTALSLQLVNTPHRSLKTVPTLFDAPPPTSRVNISFEVSGNELKALLKHQFKQFYVPVMSFDSPDTLADKFLRCLSTHITVNCNFESGTITSALLVGFDDEPRAARSAPIQFEMSDSSEPGLTNLATHPPTSNDLLPWHLAHIMRSRIYSFSAERLTIPEAAMGVDPNLASNAANLAQVLNLLQGKNPARFRLFNRIVSKIFPEIKQVTVPPTSNNAARILVWTLDSSSERDDLAFPLSESGTGIAQVMAMLYVVLTSDYPRTIIIDEPQSFLHPGAVRKLFEIFKEHPQHQYIITTHSPTAVTAADPIPSYWCGKKAQRVLCK